MQEVSGSIPLGSTISRLHLFVKIFTALAGGKWWRQAPKRR